MGTPYIKNKKKSTKAKVAVCNTTMAQVVIQSWQERSLRMRPSNQAWQGDGLTQIKAHLKKRFHKVPGLFIKYLQLTDDQL